MATDRMAELPERLSEAQRALLERRLRRAAPAGIARREEDGPAPLLFSQEQLWVIDQLVPGSTAYSLPTLLRLRGPLDRAALERSLDALVERHEGLRTRFPVVDGRPVQLVEPARRRDLPVVDLAGLPEAEREPRARELMAEAVRQPFDLLAGPLSRSVLYRLGARDHRLLLLMHHMVSDAWSQRMLAEDLAALYVAHAAGAEPSLPVLRVQPADVAAWQRRRFEAPAMRAHLDHWRERLAGELPVVTLPAYRPRPAVPSTRGAVHRRELAPGLVEAVREVGQRVRATPFMTLLAAFAALLGRYTGETDVLVGTTVAERGRADLARLVANLVNTLALRVDLSGDPTYLELVGRVREVVLDALAHAEAPYARVVEAVRPARSASHNPLFQVLFVLQDLSMEPLRAGELVVDVETLDTESTQFDLGLSVSGGLCHYQYGADLLDASTVAGLAGHYEALLAGAVERPDRPLSRLPILPPVERRRLLVEWAGAPGPYPETACVHELFQRQAARTPDAPAVVCGDARLTYGELNRRANQLAHHLRRRGVGPDVLTGICVERSLEMVVAIYGVLKAGGGYVPVEPSQPRQRVDALLDAAGVRLVLTQARHRELAARRGRDVLCLDSGWDGLAGEPDGDPAPAAHPDNLLYVMFTSGSTGQPKGVMTTHRNLVDVMTFLLRTYRFTTGDRVLQHLPYSFDMSDGELFLPLLAGAATVLLPTGGRWDPDRLLAAIREHAVTSVQFVPSLFPALLEGSGWDECPSLRHVLSGGDALLAGVNNELLARTRGAVHNFYGPTETTMGMTYWPCEPLEAHRIAPIGRPIQNTRTYVLDRWLEPVPAGVTGELCIAGVTLARGYLGAPGLTAERFVPDPHGGEPGARMYRSGDLARHLPGGDLEFVGRADHQVKLRGFRIEPDEVRVTLEGHPSVGQAVVLVRGDGPGGPTLVAYAAGRDGSTPVPGELRAFLRERLPEHMVPSAVVVLDALPRTPAGKVDRRALPPPVRPGAAVAEAPGTALEREVAGVWREVLGLDEVGLNDNFFDVGGHSLLMVRLHQRLNERLERDLTLLDLFAHPTVGALAAYLGGRVEGAELIGARRGGVLAEARRDAVRRMERKREVRR